MKTKKEVLICYQTVTPESAAIGDFEDQGEHDRWNGLTIQELTEEILSWGPIEASSSMFHKGIGYTTVDPELHYGNGSETRYSFHLKGYSESEELELYNRLMTLTKKEVRL